LKKKGGKILTFIIIAVILIVAVFSFSNCGRTRKEVAWGDFNAIVSALEKDNKIDAYKAIKILDGVDDFFANENEPNFVSPELSLLKVTVDGYVVEFDIVVKAPDTFGEMRNTIIQYTTVFARTTDQINTIDNASEVAGFSYNLIDPNETSAWSNILSYLPLILGVGFTIFLFVILTRQMGGGTKDAMGFAKTNARVNKDLKVRFSDVAGAEEEKEELKEVVEFLKNPKKFSDVGARIPKGVLLVGPPGTGKTLFAKAVAGEAGVPFFSISGSDFVEMFVGVGASRVRDLFETAKKSMPCIVFIDEIDAVGRQRGTGLGGGHDEREQTLNQLLVQMDGFETNEGIIVMAATNRADILDPALLRPGRFDRQIYVNLPDVKGREAILRVHARNKPLAKDINFKTIARMTAGFSGADIERLLNESAILAARDDRHVITNKDIYEGVNKVVIGPQKKSRVITETDKRITAYHESGHAILAKLLKNCDPVHEVSIIPRGPAAGYTMTLPDTDDDHIMKNKLLDDIVMTLGGRVAEELVIKDISAGASGDIQAVSKRARKMVTEWGMSDVVGPISYGSEKDVFIGRDMASHANYSDQMAGIIDKEVEKIIMSSLEKARKLLSENREILDRMARLLIERETIFAEEVNMLMEGKSVEEIEKFMDENEKTLAENPFERGNRTIIKEPVKPTEEVEVKNEQTSEVETDGDKTEE